MIHIYLNGPAIKDKDIIRNAYLIAAQDALFICCSSQYFISDCCLSTTEVAGSTIATP